MEDPIGFIRSKYSAKAVETEKQAEAVFRFVGIIDETERLIKEEIGEADWLGSCGLYWQTKKRILKERFGIEWQSPGDIYRGVIFD